MALGSPLELTLHRYEVRFTCGSQKGSRKVWSPSERAAGRVLQRRPALFGLPAGPAVVVTLVRELRQGES